jgi:hypothetical protein
MLGIQILANRWYLQKLRSPFGAAREKNSGAGFEKAVSGLPY